MGGSRQGGYASAAGYWYATSHMTLIATPWKVAKLRQNFAPPFVYRRFVHGNNVLEFLNISHQCVHFFEKDVACHIAIAYVIRHDDSPPEIAW